VYKIEDYLNLCPIRQLSFSSHVFFQWQWGTGQMYQIARLPTPTTIPDKDHRDKKPPSWNNDTIVLHFCILIFHILFIVMFIYKVQIKKHRSSVYATFYFILHNILSGRLFLTSNIILGQYFNITFLPMLLYIFQMRWKKFNIKIYPWITLHIIMKYFFITAVFFK
jgi:hypothetical protein